MGKNKILAAVLNFFTGGIGYLYIGKRKLFGWLMFLGVVLSLVWYLSFPYSRLVMDNIWIIVSSLVFMLGFAIDAYIEAK